MFLASIAIYVTIVVPIGNAPPFVKPVVGIVVNDTVGVPQLSVAVGAVQDATAVVPAVVKALFAGHAVSTGAIASVAQEFVCVTTTSKLQVDILFEPSIAIYVTVVVPIGNAPPFVKAIVGLVVNVKTGVPQLSVAVGVVQDARAVVPVVVKLKFAGHTNEGGVTSFVHEFVLVTVTAKLHVDVLFFASVAVYVTVVVPTGNAPPFVKPAVGLVVNATEAVPQASVAVGAAHEATAVVPVVVKFLFVGHAVKTGGVKSFVQGFVTVTLKLHITILLLASIAMYVTIVVPVGNVPPFVKPTVGIVVNVTEGVPQASVAVGAVHEATAVVPVVVKFILAGQAVITGGVISFVQGFVFVTTTLKRHVAVLFFVSVAV